MGHRAFQIVVAGMLFWRCASFSPPIRAATPRSSVGFLGLEKGRVVFDRAAKGAERIGVKASSVPERSLTDGSAPLQNLMAFLTNLFPVWVASGALLGLVNPPALAWFDGPMIELALGATMICMGSTLSLDDFKGVKPQAVALGFVAQFTFMPMMAVLSAKLFHLPPVYAAGLILVGCCPGGTASNLVTLIARADVALSVAMTSCSTMLAAVMTPLLASWLAGTVVPLSSTALVATTLRVVLAPVAVGMALRVASPGFTERLQRVAPLACVALVALICGAIVAQNAAVLHVCGAGPSVRALVGAVCTMHAGGFALGYFGAWACGNKPQVCRTVSIETGMQNSALGTVLALRALAGSAAVAGSGLPASAIALPGAISATVHSVIGSTLAGLWRLSDKRTSDRESQKD